MKWVMVMTLYIIGCFIFIMWLIGDKGRFAELKQSIKEIDGIELLPDAIIYGVYTFLIMVFSVIWPIYIVVYPIDELKSYSKKR